MQLMQKSAFAGAIEYKGEEDDPVSIVTKAVEDLTKTVDERLKKFEDSAADPEAITKRLDELETKMARPGVTTDKDETGELERKAFVTYLRRGDAAGEETLKTLTVGSEPGAGYLAPAEMSTEFIRDLVEFSPVRSIASVRNISASSVKYPRRTGITNARWENEAAPSGTGDPAFGQAEVHSRELKTHVDLSNKLLADSAGEAEQEVRLALAEDFGEKEGAAFVNGNGVLEPEGFMTNADIDFTANGHVSNLSADALITLLYALPATYRNAGSWAMNGTTLATIRKLKDGQQNYLWQPSYQAGQPETILGRPVVEMVDMPDVASGAFPIIYGDFSAYRIVDRLAMTILVNPFLLATESLTRIHATRRVGGAVLQAARFRKLKMAV